MKVITWTFAILAVLALQTSAQDVTGPPAFDQFVIVPIRIHILTSKTLDVANCRLSDEGVAKTLTRINQIWHKAGIHFGQESMVREPAANVDRYEFLAERVNRAKDAETFGLCGLLIPNSSRNFDGLHLYFAGKLPINGGYLVAADATMVGENPTLRQVEGGTDHAISRVAARGLEVALGLAIRPDDFGLISNSTNGTGLNREEVARVQLVARSIPGALSVGDAAKEAETAAKQADNARARRLWAWLSEIPGKEAEDARKRLEDLPRTKP